MPTFYRRDDAKRVTFGNLPHWSQPSAVGFVTFRLGDSLPMSVIDRIERMHDDFVRQHAFEWDAARIEYEFGIVKHNRREEYLDKGYGSCLLADSQARETIAQALAYYDGSRYRLHNYVIMPNHVHLLLDIADSCPLQDTLASIKKYTARQINLCLGRQGNVWQRESFDRLVRSYAHYLRTVRYIRNNPRYCHSGTYAYWEAPWLESWKMV